MNKGDIYFRILKPYKLFYIKAIKVALTYGFNNLKYVDKDDYVDALKHLMKDVWVPTLEKPAIEFFQVCKEEAKIFPDENLQRMFEDIRNKMELRWREGIIIKGKAFKGVKVDCC